MFGIGEDIINFNPLDALLHPAKSIADITGKTRELISDGFRESDKFIDSMVDGALYKGDKVFDFISKSEGKVLNPAVSAIQGAGYPLIFGLSLPVVAGLGIVGLILLRTL